MRSLAAITIVTVVGMLVAAVLGSCGGRPTAGKVGPASEAWVWESLDRHATLARAAGLPASHPLARLQRSPSQFTG